MEKNNEILAEFIGLTHCNSPHCIESDNLCWSKDGHIFFPKKDLKYHTSRDWFHPVWEKFRDLRFDDFDHERTHEIHRARVGYLIINGTLPEACEELVKGIMWYNSIKK